MNMYPSPDPDSASVATSSGPFGPELLGSPDVYPSGIWGFWQRLTVPPPTKGLAPSRQRERLRRARLLSALQLAALVLIAVLVPRGFLPVFDLGTVIGTVGFGVLVLVSIFVCRFGHVTTSSWIFVAGLAAAIAGSQLFTPNGEINFQDLAGYDFLVIPILIAGILLPRSASVYMWLGCALFIIFDLALAPHGPALAAFLPKNVLPILSIYPVAIYPLILTAIVAVISGLAAGSMARTLQDALDALTAIASEVVRLPIEQEEVAENAAQRITNLICQILHCYCVAIATVNPTNEGVYFANMGGLSPDEAAQLRRQAEGRALGEFLSEEQLARLRQGEVYSLVMPTLLVLAGSDFLGAKVLLAPILVEDHLSGMILVIFERHDDPISADDILVAATAAKLLAIAMENKRHLQQQTTAQAHILALQQAKERMDIFLNMASHELRTPLTSVIGYTQLARKRLARLPGTPESEQEGQIAQLATLLDDADTQAAHLNRLVEDLLEASRAEGKKLSVQFVECDITDIVREAIQGEQMAYPQRQITLQQAEATPLLVQGDRGRILQVVTNYLTNALKYAPAESSVSLGVHQDAEQVRVFVADQGPGISPEEQERIWERFYRIESRTTQNSVIPGLGMGLYLSRAIVEQHNGQVGVDSQVGKGSTFWFTLPRYHDENQ